MEIKSFTSSDFGVRNPHWGLELEGETGSELCLFQQVGETWGTSS